MKTYTTIVFDPLELSIPDNSKQDRWRMFYIIYNMSNFIQSDDDIVYQSVNFHLPKCTVSHGKLGNVLSRSLEEHTKTG